jgi:hypothetical protein
VGLLALSRWTAVNVLPFEQFTEQYPEFRVYAFGSGWLLQSLRQSGAVIEDAGAESNARLYRVRRGN